MVIRKISYYRVIVSLCLFMFLLSPVFGDENSAVSFDKELPKNNIVTIQPDSLRILHNPLTGWVLYASMGVDAADFWVQYDHMYIPELGHNVSVTDMLIRFIFALVGQILIHRKMYMVGKLILI